MMSTRLEAAPNNGDFLQTFSFRLDDGSLPDLTALDTLEASIMNPAGNQVWNGSAASGQLTIPSAGEMLLTIPSVTFAGFHPGIYRGAIRATEGTATEIIALFDLPVIAGNFP
jgi:hypothetical protein